MKKTPLALKLGYLSRRNFSIRAHFPLSQVTPEVLEAHVTRLSVLYILHYYDHILFYMAGGRIRVTVIIIMAGKRNVGRKPATKTTMATVMVYMRI